MQKVEAESVGEAIDKAMVLYYGEGIILDSGDMKDVDFIPITNKQGKNR